MSNLQYIYTIHNTYHLQKKLPNYKRTSTLTRITCPTQEICFHILLPQDVFHSKGVFVDCYCPPKHPVILVCHFIQVCQGIVVHLECKRSASQVKFEPLDTLYNC